MDSIYLTSLIVGGFFVLLSIFGVSEHDADHDVSVDVDGDLDFDADHDTDWDVNHDLGVDVAHDIGFVDLLSIRALFLFAAFFGLTGVALTALSVGEPLTGLLSTSTGLLIGIGGNYVIKKFAYEQVSSQISQAQLKGKSGRALLPFSGQENGKILLKAGGKRIQVTARLFQGNATDSIMKDDEVVIVHMDGRIAEVLKPD